MQIQTRSFGAVQIDEAQIITLTEPMPGFPEHTRFVVLHPDPEMPFQWFQSVDDADVCFLVADPNGFFPDYRIELKPLALADLEIGADTEAAVAVIVNMPDDPVAATANLLAPIVINVAKKRARQVILEGSGHPVRAPLFPKEDRRAQAG